MHNFETDASSHISGLDVASNDDESLLDQRLAELIDRFSDVIESKIVDPEEMRHIAEAICDEDQSFEELFDVSMTEGGMRPQDFLIDFIKKTKSQKFLDKYLVSILTKRKFSILPFMELWEASDGMNPSREVLEQFLKTFLYPGRHISNYRSDWEPVEKVLEFDPTFAGMILEHDRRALGSDSNFDIATMRRGYRIEPLRFDLFSYIYLSSYKQQQSNDDIDKESKPDANIVDEVKRELSKTEQEELTFEERKILLMLNMSESSPDPVLYASIPPCVSNELAELYKKYPTYGLGNGHINLRNILAASWGGQTEKLEKLSLNDSGKQIDKLITDFFSELIRELKQKGFDGETKDLSMRTVSGTGIKNEEKAQDVFRIIDEAKINGGKKNDDLPGFCVQELNRGGQGDEFFERQVKGIEPGVLFLYDNRKLEPLTEQEKATSPLFSAWYGFKPKQGETCKSAMVMALTIN